MISSAVWKSLDAQEREWLQKAADESSSYQRELWAVKTKESMAKVIAAGVEIVDWFWDETAAARVLWALRSLCRDSADPAMREAEDRFAPDHIITRLSETEVSSWRE